MKADELARRAGTTVARIAEMTELGLLEASGAGGSYRPADVHRVRFLEALASAGISLTAVARLVAEGAYPLRFVESTFADAAPPLGDVTYAEAAAEAGLAWEVVEQLYVTWGLAVPDPEQRIREDDLAALRGRAEAQRVAGIDGSVLVAMSRFYGDNIRRMAASQAAFFRENIMAPRLARTEAPAEELEALAPIAAELQRLNATLRTWLFARHLEAQIFQSATEIVEASLAARGWVSGPSTRVPAIAFLDLSGFTRLTDQAGDAAATELAARLTEVVGRAAREFGAEPVKLLGDGVMFHFESCRGASRGALALVEAAGRAELPPARVGVHAGPVVFRDGDYFGQTVNVAARITDYARPREVLVSAAVAEAAAPDDGIVFDSIGEISLKGVRDPVPLFQARRAG